LNCFDPCITTIQSKFIESMYFATPIYDCKMFLVCNLLTATKFIILEVVVLVWG